MILKPREENEFLDLTVVVNQILKDKFWVTRDQLIVDIFFVLNQILVWAEWEWCKINSYSIIIELFWEKILTKEFRAKFNILGNLSSRDVLEMINNMINSSVQEKFPEYQSGFWSIQAEIGWKVASNLQA